MGAAPANMVRCFRYGVGFVWLTVAVVAPASDLERAVQPLPAADVTADVRQARRQAVASPPGTSPIKSPEAEAAEKQAAENTGSPEKAGIQLAALPRPGCLLPHRPQPPHSQVRPCPPAEPTLPPVLPDSPEKTPPSLDPARPTAPALPVVPPAEALQDGSIVRALPDLPQAPAPPRTLARGADIGGIRANYSTAPNLIGDGGGPQSAGGTLSLGRLMIEANGLSPSGTGPGPAQLNSFSSPNADLNSIQAIAGAGYPTFTLPTQPLGSVPGTTPVALTGSGVGGITDPGGVYQAAAQNAFETNPNLPGTQGIAGTAEYVQAASGSLPNGSQQDAFLFYDYLIDGSIVFPGYAVGFVKLTENMSPIPRDRVYMNYSYFNNANFNGARADVNRFMPGLEKTFYDGWTSVEIRTPFAATLDNAQDIVTNPASGVASVSEYRDIQFGNMSVIFKTLLIERETWALTAGVQTMLPTADNTFVNGPTAASDGQSIQQVFVANESVHVMPFVGGIWAPNDRFFNQLLLQIDRDVNGNLAYVNGLQNPAATGRGLQQAGRVYYPTFMYLSFGTGYWLFKDDTQRFTGFSPVLELHINQAFEAFQPVHFQGYQLGQNPGVVSVTNALVGCNFEWGTRSTLTFAYVTPLDAGADRFFDGELRALYNLRFGRQNRLTRAQF